VNRQIDIENAFRKVHGLNVLSKYQGFKEIAAGESFTLRVSRYIHHHHVTYLDAVNAVVKRIKKEENKGA